MTIPSSCSGVMAISPGVTLPLPCCSSISSHSLRISRLSDRIPRLESVSLSKSSIRCYSPKIELVADSSYHSVPQSERIGNGDVEFLVVTFYKFVSIRDPETEVSKHLAFLQERDIHGRIYLNEQGINAQIEGGMSHLPVLDHTVRATLLSPAGWRKRLQAASNIKDLSNTENHAHDDRRLLLLDVRNGYEWDVGHFQGAERPNVECFRCTSFGISTQEFAALDPLSGVDKENTDVLMYCTGGIRCDVYSTILRQRGFRNLYTLKGGVSHYLMSEGSAGWVGNLFVFDSRLSLPPSTYNPRAPTRRIFEIVSENDSFAKCYICSLQILEFRHRNCANLDCNRLFLCCGNCVKEFSGCCCSACTQAPRLRPVLHGHQRYQKWNLYRDSLSETSE